jgi:hypothetical protein
MMNMEEAQISNPNPKGRAIPGLDYGIDMLDEAPPAASSPSPSPPPQPQFQKPRFNFNQQPRQMMMQQ